MKVWTYIYIAITMIIFFELTGFSTGFTGIFSFLNIQFNPDHTINNTAIGFSGFKEYLYGGMLSSTSGWLALLLGTGIAVGLYASGKPDIAIKAGFATAIFGSFIPTLYFAVTHAHEVGVSGWAISLLGIIFIPFSVMFLFALVEWVVGGTSD